MEDTRLGMRIHVLRGRFRERAEREASPGSELPKAWSHPAAEIRRNRRVGGGTN